MEFYDKLKQFLGFPAPQESPDSTVPERRWPQQEPPRNEDEEPFHGGFGRNFNIFADPLEIHKYFEQQMSEMLKNFGFNEFPDSFGHNFGDGFNQLIAPEIAEEEVPSGNLRDQFLKPGFEKSKNDSNDDKRDQDLDGKLDIRDWSSVFKGQHTLAPRTHFYGQCTTSKTIRNSDGSVETHHSVRDNEGNEETVIKRRIGDKEHSIIKKRDKDGKEETIENLVNLDEKDVEKFFPKQQQRLPEIDRQQGWPLFDRFFK